MPIPRLKRFLDEHQIKYTATSHSPAYTAQEVAEAAHIPGKELAKTVIVKLDDRMCLAVVPASERVNVESLAAETHSKHAHVVGEKDFERLFPGCEVGAMPPFGNLWNLPVYVSRTLSDDDQIAFSAGTHSEVLSLAFEDFRRLVKPELLNFSEQFHPQ